MMEYKILIIDDNAADCRFLNRLLEDLCNWRLTVECCSDIAEINKVFFDFQPDITFVDYRLGAASGTEVIELLSDAEANTAFILQTGQGDERVATEALRAGAMDYLVKSDLSAESLGRSLRYVINRREMNNELKRHRDDLDRLVQERTAEVRILSEAVEQSPVSVQIANCNGDIIYINPQTLRDTGSVEAELVGENLETLLVGACSNETNEDVWGLITSGNTWRGESKGQRANGATYWKRLAVAPVNEPSGAIANYVLIAEDITSEKELEEELRERSRQLEAALSQEKQYNTLQRDFMSLVSHEFRTPMAIIDGVAQTLLRRIDRLTTENITDRLHKVRSSIKSMNDLIDGGLKVTEINANRSPTDLTECDLKSMIQGCSQFQESGIKLPALELQLDGLPTHIQADPGSLETVFNALIGNAAKYVSNVPAIKIIGTVDGDEVVIAFEDNGVCIPGDELPRIFERFYRASTSIGRGGIGVGLYIAKELLAKMGGYICVESEVGKGSTFTVYLPVREKPPAGIKTDKTFVAEDTSAERPRFYTGGSGLNSRPVERLETAQ
ncbi:MAG: PAS domain S-box protein [Rhodospirillales bacterium]|nr:PAS domain S-box protein [Rhodospirillales bacterium]